MSRKRKAPQAWEGYGVYSGRTLIAVFHSGIAAQLFAQDRVAPGLRPRVEPVCWEMRGASLA